MALWAKVQQLNGPAIQKVRSLYGDHFPIEVRFTLADWIEEKVLNTSANISPDNPTHQPYIRTLVMDFITALEGKAQAMVNNDPYLIRGKLIDAASSFRYLSNPLDLFKNLRYYLAVENYLVDQMAAEALLGPTSVDGDGEEISGKLKQLKQQTQSVEFLLKRVEGIKEEYNIDYHRKETVEANILHSQRIIANNLQSPQLTTVQVQSVHQEIKKMVARKEAFESKLTQMRTYLTDSTNVLEQKIGVTVEQLRILLAKVLDEKLASWKNDQKLGVNEVVLSNNLDTLQSWCGALEDLMWNNRQQLKEVERLKQGSPLYFTPQSDNSSACRLGSLLEKVTQLLSSLITSALVIEKQPEQVIRTNKGFKSSLRFLVRGGLNLHMTPPRVKVSIISEAQLQSLVQHNVIDSKSQRVTTEPTQTTTIVNNVATMTYDHRRNLSVQFGHMKLNRISRASQTKDETVMSEKMCLHFQCQFSLAEKLLDITVWTVSLPVVVVVHSNQEPKAWATIAWDNAFGETGRMPFEVPHQAPWLRVAQALSDKFESINGRALTEENKMFLGEKMYCGSNFNIYEFCTLSQFCREALLGRGFTFWEWFYANLKLTQDYFSGPWKDGLVHGFLSRQQADAMLSKCHPGTFLLRFSDSVLGGIAVSWIHSDRQVYSLAPYVSKDLDKLSLPKQIINLPELTYLYPNIPKASVFDKYCKEQNKEVGSYGFKYVGRDLRPYIPTLDANNGNQTMVNVNGFSSPPASPMLPDSTNFQCHSPDYSFNPPSLNDSVGLPSFGASFGPSNFGSPLSHAFHAIVEGMTMDSDDGDDFTHDINELSQTLL